jgi:hypothetical protein
MKIKKRKKEEKKKKEKNNKFKNLIFLFRIFTLVIAIYSLLNLAYNKATYVQ